MNAMEEIRVNLSDSRSEKNLWDRVLYKLNRRLDYILNDTLMLAGKG